MSARAWAAFAAMSVLWGIPYLFIKIAVDDGVPPAFLAWARVALAAAVLLPLAARAGTLRPLRGRGWWLALYATFEVALPYPMIAFGETRISSATTAIGLATVPVIASLLALCFVPDERAGPRRVVGLLLGFGGVAALVGIDVSGDADELVGIGAIVLAAAGFAGGPFVLARRLRGLDGRATMGTSLALAIVPLTPFAALDPPRAVPSAGAVAAIVVLGTLCTAVALVVFAELVRTAGPSRAVIVSYVNPLVAVALGVALLGERPGVGTMIGLVLILAGSWLATDGRLPAPLERRLARRRSCDGAHGAADVGS